MTARVRSADWLAGIGGLVLFVSLWLPWYGIDPSAFRDVGGNAQGIHFLVTSQDALAILNTYAVADASAWQALSEIDVLLALLALPAIGVPISAALAKGPATPVAFTVIATTAGILAVLLVLFRLLDQPGSNELVAVKYGAWIGLAGAVLQLVGSWRAMADEHTPGAVPPQLQVRPAP